MFMRIMMTSDTKYIPITCITRGPNVAHDAHVHNHTRTHAPTDTHTEGEHKFVPTDKTQTHMTPIAVSTRVETEWYTPRSHPSKNTWFRWCTGRARVGHRNCHVAHM
eukprot:m.175392 g.175392  ORF g.175392 m.175392 type:complete len:107 (-) comp18350_c0_seq19:1481-1801(-)